MDTAPMAMDRPSWVLLRRGIFSPAAVSDRPGHVVLFARGEAGDLLRAENEQDAWSEFRLLGAPVARSGVPLDWPLAVCSDEQGRIHLFGRGPDGELLHGLEAGGAFAGFECVGVPAASTGYGLVPMGLAGPPAACSVGDGRIDVFAVGHGGALLHAELAADGFGDFESLEAPAISIAGMERQVPLLGAPAACSAGARVAVVVRSFTGDLALRWRDGGGWTRWSSLGAPTEPDSLYPAVRAPAPLSGPPAACSAGPRHVELLARGFRGDLMRRVWDGEIWGDYASAGGPFGRGGQGLAFTGTCSACWDGTSIHALARAADGAVYHARWAPLPMPAEEWKSTP